MKNLILTLSVFSFLFISCTEDSTNEINNENANLETNITKLNLTRGEISGNSKLNFREAITCQGNCTGTTTKCTVQVPLDNPEYAECSCTGCALHIIFDRNQEKEVGINNSQTFLSDFINHIKDDFSSKSLNNVSIKQIVVEDYNDVRIVVYEYYDFNNRLESVMLVKKKDEQQKMGGPTIVVDCSGGCESPGATCRERYIISTGDVECTCSGSCVMEISEKR